MALSSLDPETLKVLADAARQVSAHLKRMDRADLPPDPQAARAQVLEAQKALEAARTYLEVNPLPDAETTKALLEGADRAGEQAQAFIRTNEKLDGDAMQALADFAERAYCEAQAFRKSNPLPEPEVLRDLTARHLEYLDDLDVEYGPPSLEDVERAKKLLRSLGGGS